MIKDNKSDDRIRCIPVLSFYMTCIFVIYHVMIPMNSVSKFDQDLYSWIVTLNEQLATIALAYFFGVTGFLLFRNMTEKNLFRKIKTRFITLLVPYLFWQFLVLGVFYLTGRFRSVDLFLHYLRSMFLFDGYPPDIPLWYMYTVFVWALLSPLLLLLLRNRKVGFIVLMVSFIGIYFVMSNEACASFTRYGIISLTLKYTFAYLMGAYFGLHFPDRGDLDSMKYIAFTILFGFAISSNNSLDLRTSFLIAVIPILLIRFFPEKLCKDRKIYNTSLIIFAIHYPLYQYLLDFIRTLSLTGVSASLINIMARVLFLAAVIGLSYLIYLLLSKVAPKFLKLITGGRV